jgi:hypothetical protein
MKIITTLIIACITLVIQTNAYANSNDRTTDTLAKISEYLETRWDNVPIQRSTIPESFSLNGTFEYQVEIDMCWLMDSITVKVQNAHIFNTIRSNTNNKPVSVTVGIGKKVEGGWNIFHTDEPYEIKSSDFTPQGFIVNDQDFDLIDFVCDEITSELFPEQDDPSWIVFQITFENRATVYAHGNLRTDTQTIF